MSNLKTFLIKQGKTGYNAGEIVRNPQNGYIGVAICNSITNEWQAMKLVVCDMEVEVDLGCLVYSVRGLVGAFGFFENSDVDESYKIIASHPQLPNTAPLPEAFIREYVRLQGECSIVMEELFHSCPNDEGRGCVDCEGYSIGNCPAMMQTVLKCVPTPAVIDEETGENVLKTVGMWASDTDMLEAYNAGRYSMVMGGTYTLSTDWLTEYKKSKK